MGVPVAFGRGRRVKTHFNISVDQYKTALKWLPGRRVELQVVSWGFVVDLRNH